MSSRNRGGSGGGSGDGGGFLGWLKRLFGAGPVPLVAGLNADESRAVSEFAKHLGIHFNDPRLLCLALTHRSFLHIQRGTSKQSNERLEFLGDSVLGLITSEHLYKSFPSEHEGQLTKTKSLLVSKAILSRRALAMGLGRFVLMSNSEVDSGGRQRLSILADAFESVLGAIYLDQGIEAARKFVETWLLNEAKGIVQDKRHTNYKSLLQEYVQSAYHTHPVYSIRHEHGPDHSKLFTVEVRVGGKPLGSGKGKNKKEAEQVAARDALDRVAAESGEKSRGRDSEVEPVRGDRPPRAERAERGERGERGDRPQRADRPDRGERGERGERGVRGERGERAPRADRAERPERPERLDRAERMDRPERLDRPAREERMDRPEREPRGDRPAREGRPERVGRPERRERRREIEEPAEFGAPPVPLEREERAARPERAPRREREERAERPERSERPDREPRGDRGERGERPPRGDRPERAPQPRRDTPREEVRTTPAAFVPRELRTSRESQPAREMPQREAPLAPAASASYAEVAPPRVPVDLSGDLVWETPATPSPERDKSATRYGRQPAVKSRSAGLAQPASDPSRRPAVSEAPASAPSTGGVSETPESAAGESRPRYQAPRIDAQVREVKGPLPGVDATRYRAAEAPASRFASETPSAWEEEPKEHE